MNEVKFGRGRRALVVDDEASLTDVMARMLEGVGFLVMTLESGSHACVLLQTTLTPPDLLITDSRMKGANGAELIAVARRRFPSLPIIFTTGDAGYDPALTRIPPDVLTLYKPFTLDELLGCAHHALLVATH
jgi:DNA-binding NtrC family response regulator